MGMSLYAKVFYGFPLWETFSEHEEYDREKSDHYKNEGYMWEEELLESILPKPKDEDYGSDAWKEWRRRRDAAMASIPLDAVMVGWGEFTYYALAIRSSLRVADDGDTVAITIPFVDAAWNDQLREWCETHGFKYRDPSWQLAALYW